MPSIFTINGDKYISLLSCESEGVLNIREKNCYYLMHAREDAARGETFEDLPQDEVTQAYEYFECADDVGCDHSGGDPDILSPEACPDSGGGGPSAGGPSRRKKRSLDRRRVNALKRVKRKLLGAFSPTRKAIETLRRLSQAQEGRTNKRSKRRVQREYYDDLPEYDDEDYEYEAPDEAFWAEKDAEGGEYSEDVTSFASFQKSYMKLRPAYRKLIGHQ